MTCKDNPTESISNLIGTSTPLIPKCYADLDVTILIGLLRWRLGMKRDVTQAFLQTKGIYLPTGTISNRSLDLLLLFRELHRSKKGKIKTFFESQGGLILHEDGTHKSGGKVVFVLQEGISDIIIDSELIASESEENVKPILLKLKENFGSPLVVVRDMAEGLKLSASSVFPGKPQQICQVHFVRDLEKDLVTQYHKRLRSSIVKHKLTSKLRKLRNIHKRKVELDDDIKQFLRDWVHIAIDYLLHPIVKRLKWISQPISYFLQYVRIKEIHNLVKRFIRWTASQNVFFKPVMIFDTYLKSVLKDEKVLDGYCLLQQILDWLNELRGHLRISRENHLKDSPAEDIDLEQTMKDTREALAKIRKEGREKGEKYPQIALKINRAFTKHWDELFVPYPVVNGKRIVFRRHNNGLESSHRRTRKAIRERTGRAATSIEMEQFGDLLAILSNLWSKTYQDEILNDVEDLASELSKFVDDLPRLRKEHRSKRRGAELPIADKKRLPILKDFIDTLETTEDSEELIRRLHSILGFENNVGVV